VSRQRKHIFVPTPEQQVGLKLFMGGGNTKLEALAGTGKTTELKLFGRAVPDEKGIYIAFNSSIAKEAGRTFPGNVECRTMHSLAFQAVGKRYANERGLPPRAPRVTARQVTYILDIKSGVQAKPGLVWGPDKIARLVIETVKRYCYSADTEIKPYHVPRTPGTEDNHDEIVDTVLRYTDRAWADIKKLDGQLRFEHDYYLKMWALTDPVIECDFAMLDEGQDSNPITLGIFTRQADFDTQLVIVGDRYQSIYGWRGATNAMADFEAEDTAYLTKSFRFGPAVAEEANKWLTLLGAEIRVEGYEEIDSVVESIDDPFAILCRTNAQVIAEALAAQSVGKRVAVAGGTREIVYLAESARDLMNGMGTSHPDLMGFKDWNEVVQFTHEDDGAADLRVLVNLIDKYGVEEVITIASRTVEEKDGPDLVVSTAHKAKGREWTSVRIASDFREPEDESMESEVNKSDAMLAYVSVTRAQHKLDSGGLAWVDNWIANIKRKEEKDGAEETPRQARRQAGSTTADSRPAGSEDTHTDGRASSHRR
jgi:superfamily I DNA/RNA helicase